MKTENALVILEIKTNCADTNCIYGQQPKGLMKGY